MTLVDESRDPAPVVVDWRANSRLLTVVALTLAAIGILLALFAAPPDGWALVRGELSPGASMKPH